MVEQREKEILQIVRSIHDLNEIFKDLATMVVDQVCLELFLLYSILSAYLVIVHFTVVIYLIVHISSEIPFLLSIDAL